MKKIKPSLLLHPLFIIALFVLLFNDFYWKYSYNNWFTGKLSDVAGLIVLPVFCFSILPAVPRKIILVISAIFFIWWKSPLSQPVIDFLNFPLHIPVQRVVDYTDLFALVALFPAAGLQPKSIALRLPLLYILRWGLGATAFFSLCATSYYRPLFQAHPNNNEIYFHESITVKTPSSAVLMALSKKGIVHRLDSVIYYPLTNQQDLYYKHRQNGDTNVLWQNLSQSGDSTIYLKREDRQPYHLIPYYETKVDETQFIFRNIRFTLSENNKGTKATVTVQMFEQDGVSRWGFLDRKTRNEYKRIFEVLFR